MLQAISYDLFLAMIHKNGLNDSMLLYLQDYLSMFMVVKTSQIKI